MELKSHIHSAPYVNEVAGTLAYAHERKSELFSSGDPTLRPDFSATIASKIMILVSVYQVRSVLSFHSGVRA